MKVCITAVGYGIESQVDQRFGRAAYFIIWDNKNNNFEAIANPNIDADSGSGIQSAQLVVVKDVAVVLTGDVGPKAKQVLQESGIEIVAGAQGAVKDALEQYLLEE